MESRGQLDEHVAAEVEVFEFAMAPKRSGRYFNAVRQIQVLQVRSHKRGREIKMVVCCRHRRELPICPTSSGRREGIAYVDFPWAACRRQSGGLIFVVLEVREPLRVCRSAEPNCMVNVLATGA